MRPRRFTNLIWVATLVMVLGCETTSDKKNHKIVVSEDCFQYVERYLEFRKTMISGNSEMRRQAVIDTLVVPPETLESPSELQKLVAHLYQHEKDIQSITEYYAACDVNNEYASMGFKIADKDERIKRLYIVYSEGKIRTLSKEVEATVEAFDRNKSYIKFTVPVQ